MMCLLLRFWLLLFVLVPAMPAVSSAVAAKPAIVLVAFGTSTPAAATYDFFEKQVRDGFPGYEIRWAFTSQKVRAKVKKEQGRDLKDLPQVLGDLKAAGFAQVAVQSLHVVPGEEWEEMVKESEAIPGLQVSLGPPLLTSPEDRQRVLKALEPAFPKDLKQTAVVLVGHGSPHPRGEGEYLAFAELVRRRFPQQQAYLAVVAGKPTREEVLQKVKASSAQAVLFIPFLFVAGEHMAKDIMGDEPESWKSELLKHKAYKIQAVDRGLGYQGGVVQVYLDHLAGALKKVSSEQ
ncbi:MAG: hypothetical protein FJ126_03605 [Deltaproteobacteria bacterium]|nr:hypothetical protein [Deltaproteobacteria bacterium]